MQFYEQLQEHGLMFQYNFRSCYKKIFFYSSTEHLNEKQRRKRTICRNFKRKRFFNSFYSFYLFIIFFFFIHFFFFFFCPSVGQSALVCVHLMIIFSGHLPLSDGAGIFLSDNLSMPQIYFSIQAVNIEGTPSPHWG